jgi:O-antigen/teichoic acid export membrane protein
MTANEDLRWLNIISFGGLTLNLVLNFSLIPGYGALGAAFTTMITQLFAGTAMLLFVIGKFNYGFNIRLTSQFVLYALLAIALNLFLVNYTDMADFAVFIFSLLAGGLLLIVTGLFSFKKFMAMLKSHQKPRG